MDPDRTRLSDGRLVTWDELDPLIYDHLRRVASSMLRREAGPHTLQPTALVHEAYLRLTDLTEEDTEGRRHFIGIAARVMRRVLVDSARRRRREKHGGQRQRITLADPKHDVSTLADVLDLDAALNRLAEVSERYARIVELRFFGGLSGEEIAAVLGVSRTIITRDWAKARSWLSLYLEEGQP